VSRRARVLVFVVVLVVVLVVLLHSEGEYSHAARHFLSNLLRRMF
jgi:hypothetical protein